MVGPVPASWAVAPESAGATEVASGVWRLRLPTAWEGIPHVNAYALETEDGALLVDCGTAGDESCWQALVLALGEAGFGIEDVRLLVATHAHSDHIGPAARLVTEASCGLAMHPNHGHLYEVMRDPARFEAARERRARQEGVPEEALHLYRDVGEEVDGVLAPVEPTLLLTAGVTLETRVGQWEVVETPGHAPSHIVLHLRGEGIVAAGDLVSPVFAPYFDYGFTPDPVGEYVASVEAVAALSPEALLPGHGRPLERRVLDEHLEATAERVEATLAAVQAGAAGAHEITRRVFGEPVSAMFRVWQFTEIAAYLRHLRVAGRVVRDQLPDGTLSYRAV